MLDFLNFFKYPSRRHMQWSHQILKSDIILLKSYVFFSLALMCLYSKAEVKASL
jgi:hypothetical protein